MVRDHYTDYSLEATLRCERALLTIIGDIGPWSERVVLIGGLAPPYIVGSLPPRAIPHAGTRDVDFVLHLAVGDSSEAYETLQSNLKKSGFVRDDPSYRWSRSVEGTRVHVEFICETDQVETGRIYRPRQGAGSKFAAFNARGAGLVAQDFIESSVEGERLDGGGLSKVTVRVAGVLSYVTLKALAFQDRHQNKDAYDLVYTLVNYPCGGARSAGVAAAASTVRHERSVRDALHLLGERFARAGHDGPTAYADFLAEPYDNESKERLRNTAVEAVEQFLVAAGAL